LFRSFFHVTDIEIFCWRLNVFYQIPLNFLFDCKATNDTKLSGRSRWATTSSVAMGHVRKTCAMLVIVDCAEQKIKLIAKKTNCGENNYIQLEK